MHWYRMATHITNAWIIQMAFVLYIVLWWITLDGFSSCIPYSFDFTVEVSIDFWQLPVKTSDSQMAFLSWMVARWELIKLATIESSNFCGYWKFWNVFLNFSYSFLKNPRIKSYSVTVLRNAVLPFVIMALMKVESQTRVRCRFP